MWVQVTVREATTVNGSLKFSLNKTLPSHYKWTSVWEKNLPAKTCIKVVGLMYDSLKKQKLKIQALSKL